MPKLSIEEDLNSYHTQHILDTRLPTGIICFEPLLQFLMLGLSPFFVWAWCDGVPYNPSSWGMEAEGSEVEIQSRLFDTLTLSLHVSASCLVLSVCVCVPLCVSLSLCMCVYVCSFLFKLNRTFFIQTRAYPWFFFSMFQTHYLPEDQTQLIAWIRKWPSILKSTGMFYQMF